MPRRAEQVDARAATEAAIAAERAKDRRRRQLKLGIAVAVAAVIVVVCAIAFSGSSDSQPTQNAGFSVEQTLASVAQDGVIAGDPSSPVSIVEYGDLQCPVCRAHALDELPDVMDELIKTGRATYEFRNWTIISKDSLTAATASLAAAEQNRYLQFVLAFFARQGVEKSGYVTDAFLEDRAREAGLDLAQFNSDRKNPALTRQVQDDYKEAFNRDLRGTPTFVVSGPGGEETLSGLVSAADLAAAVEKVS